MLFKAVCTDYPEHWANLDLQIESYLQVYSDHDYSKLFPGLLALKCIVTGFDTRLGLMSLLVENKGPNLKKSYKNTSKN